MTRKPPPWTHDAELAAIYLIGAMVRSGSGAVVGATPMSEGAAPRNPLERQHDGPRPKHGPQKWQCLHRHDSNVRGRAWARRVPARGRGTARAMTKDMTKTRFPQDVLGCKFVAHVHDAQGLCNAVPCTSAAHKRRLEGADRANMIAWLGMAPEGERYAATDGELALWLREALPVRVSA